ncbi:MAG: transcription antitermination factor NusB [Succiniclasticum sp.]|nr:transcription antitermination factor NusB [Succiniclasticum sp.]MDY6087828.1 transcription antitermination factor NusB [Succiniclasticum sp.]
MIRRIAREMVLQSLFQMDFIDAAEESQTVLTGTQENSESVPPDSEQDPVKQPALADALQVALEVQADEGDAEEAQKAVPYAKSVLQSTVANLAQIDALIGKYAINWEVKRMPGIDRNILRMAICEMRFAREKIPVTVAINEAVELAKLFGSEASARFVNGVLGKLMREEK